MAVNNNKLVLLTFTICRLIVTVVPELLDLGLQGRLSVDTWELEAASVDFGRLSRGEPSEVVHPATAEDVARVVKAAFESPFAVSARGHGHSINGQALIKEKKGVVIEMGKSDSGDNNDHNGDSNIIRVCEKGMYVDVWGGKLWIDVLSATLEYGLAPMSWTDYLYLSVGGTLSNAGISGQTFNHGPQITNVYELDVVTGNLIYNIICIHF